jgi:hypothetical protein
MRFAHYNYLIAHRHSTGGRLGQLPRKTEHTFLGNPTSVCLDSFVFAEFFRNTGKTVLADSGL